MFVSKDEQMPAVLLTKERIKLMYRNAIDDYIEKQFFVSVDKYTSYKNVKSEILQMKFVSFRLIIILHWSRTLRL